MAIALLIICMAFVLAMQELEYKQTGSTRQKRWDEFKRNFPNK